MSANVTKYEVSKVQIPSIFESEDRGLDRCASPQLVLASLSSNSRYKNDITKIAVVCDVLTVELERSNGTIIAAPGLVVDFPHQSNAKGFVIDWRQLSTILPSGATVIDTDCYKIKISFEIAGTEGSYYYGAYRLKTWSIEVARNTVQVFSILNDVVRDDGINYRDSGFGGTIRFEGSFGYMQPNFDTKNLTYSDRSRKKVRNEALRTYELRTSYVTNCITEELDNDHLLAANQIWVTEHNPVAHKQYRQFPVILSEEESPSMEYTLGHKAKLIATFKDKVATHESKYDGSIEAKLNISFDLPQGTQVEGCLPATEVISDTASNILYTDNIPSGTTNPRTILDGDIQINSVSTFSILAEGAQNIIPKDSDGNVLTVSSVVGDVVTFDAVGWVRPSDWIDMPNEIDVLENNFYGLLLVYENEDNIASFRAIATGGYSVDDGNGNITTHGSGIVETKFIDFNDCDISTERTDQFGLKYRQTIIHIYPTISGNDFDSYLWWKLDNNQIPSNYADIFVNTPYVNSLSENETPLPFLERFLFVGVLPTMSYAHLFTNTPKLQVVNIDWTKVTNHISIFGNSGFINKDSEIILSNPLATQFLYSANVGVLQDIERIDYLGTFFISGSRNAIRSKKPTLTLNMPNLTTLAMQYLGDLSTHIILNAASFLGFTLTFRDNLAVTGYTINSPDITNVNGMFYKNRGCRFIEFSECANIANVDANTFYLCISLEILIIPNWSISINLSPTAIGRTGAIRIFNDIADLTGGTSQDIVLTGTPAALNLTPTDILIATNKNWTITT